MPLVIESYILLFFACSMAGWVMEVVCQFVRFGRFINRGFLIGPYCPIYGCGAALITLTISRYRADPLSVLALSMLLCGTLEYATSYAMEKLFHARWWDYSQKHFNLNGRVCANTLIPFGLFGLLLVEWVQPLGFELFARIPDAVRLRLCVFLCALMTVDAIVSANVLGKIRICANLSGGDDTESITRMVREKLAEEGLLVRRTLAAFPYARLYSNTLVRRVRAQEQKLRLEAGIRSRELREEINRREQALREEIRKLKRVTKE